MVLTEEGEPSFLRLREAAVAFDAQLRTGVTEAEIATLTTLLTRLTANLAEPASADSAMGGLADHR